MINEKFSTLESVITEWELVRTNNSKNNLGAFANLMLQLKQKQEAAATA